ncbi:MAG: hypothetical protein A3E32_01580 [Candidatus Zambryskibacteria bacterium RIFCSPHIGHO2_12_FULL_38_37]|uniref:PrsW family intramembrane metalloprotease n=2 Tax=Candidatus Zambryskiibacteriota TaxID=1817925 RepID=A0A1G2USJ3_9BACT|nr:MAG: hypothetical protein A3E32_01580 [Candidatus Zambryskibacteria bacterium RIFCSPHIGHO2_12_FULL_38_37]OHB12292.1 MAG: hypothetical protein A2Y49_02460 [Candidatus Zambryskibacteria bacterium RIFCSPLOWO2_12_39_8]
MINNRLEIKNLAISFFSGFAGLFAYWFVIVIVEFPDIPFRFFIYGALVEEILKFSIILILVLLFKINPLSTIVLGVGYGFAEEISHFWYPDGDAGLIALWMHLIVGIVMTLLIVKAFKLKSKLYFALALLVPIALHGFYNSHLLYVIVYLMP